MEQSSAKDARRLRVLTLTSWIACAYSTVFAASPLLKTTPGMGKVTAVHALAALVYALIAVAGRVAPLAAAVAGISFAYAYAFVVTCLIGTGMGTSMYYLTLAGLAFALLGTQRVLLAALFGLLAAVLICVLEALVPYNTG